MANKNLAGWELVWDDDFDGDALDTSKWRRCPRGGADWMNTMSKDPRLVTVSESVLHLHGIVNDRDDDKAPYITGGVDSKGKFEFTYGKVVIKARFKSAQGAWPALWMLGDENRWPHCGEIDLMEHLNFDEIAYQTIHSAYTHHVDTTNTPPHSTTAPIQRDEWNTYGCEWDADKIVFTVNGEATLTYPRVPEKGEAQWPFHAPLYFILSMQIGGAWVNETGATNPDHYPAGMEIDWVRVYRQV